MRKILLVSTALVGLTLLGFPAQAKSSFGVFDHLANFGHAVAHRFKHKPQMQNNINDNLINEKTDAPLREWVFHRYPQESIDASTYGHSFETSTDKTLSYLPKRQKRSIGAEGLRNLFGGQPDHNVLMDSSESVAVAEAQYLVDNQKKFPLIDDVWLDQFNSIYGTHYALMPTTMTVTATTITTQPYREVKDSKDIFNKLPSFKNSLGVMSVEEAQYLPDNQLERVLREVWKGQLN